MGVRCVSAGGPLGVRSSAVKVGNKEFDALAGAGNHDFKARTASLNHCFPAPAKTAKPLCPAPQDRLHSPIPLGVRSSAVKAGNKEFDALAGAGNHDFKARTASLNHCFPATTKALELFFPAFTAGGPEGLGIMVLLF